MRKPVREFADILHERFADTAFNHLEHGDDLDGPFDNVHDDCAAHHLDDDY